MIRLATGFRMFVVAWFQALGLFAVIFGANALIRRSWAAALVALGILLAMEFVAWRWATLALSVDNDCLIVRQFFRTRVINRTEIASFRVGGARREAPGLAVRAVLKQGATVVLAATGWYFRTPAEVEASCTALEAWLRTGAVNVS